MSPKILALTTLPLMVMRLAWYAAPSLAVSAVFWSLALVAIAGWSSFLRKRAIPRNCAVIAGMGALLNGVVTVSNGGFMPVHGKPADFQEGIWRSAAAGDNLLFLADRMSWGGASPGDFFLLAGVVVAVWLCVTRLGRKVSRRWRARSERRAAASAEREAARQGWLDEAA